MLVTDWIDLQLLYAKESPGFTPPIVSRAFGYCGLAVYESVVHGTSNGKSLVGQLTDLNYLPTPDASRNITGHFQRMRLPHASPPGCSRMRQLLC